MQITGQITQAGPIDPYNGVNYQNISIQTPTGVVHGRIGSKQQGGYQVGTQITVNVEQAQNRRGPYNKLTRVNPNQQGGSSKGGNGGQTNDVRGKCLHGVICAGIASNQLACGDLSAVNYWVDVMMGKQPQPQADGVTYDHAGDGSDLPF